MTISTKPRSTKPIEGVTEILTQRTKRGRVERLYRCANGWAVGAVANHPFCLGDDERPFEAFLIGTNGVPAPGYQPVGYLTEQALRELVTTVAAYIEEDEEAAS